MTSLTVAEDTAMGAFYHKRLSAPKGGHHMANSLQWGSVVFHLNHDQFREAFLDGRRYYFEDINGEHPERAATLTATDVLSQILVRDKYDGHYHFDFEGPDHPVEFAAIFLGYATAPLFPETPQEREHRLRYAERVELIPGRVTV
jgi:hypothetical protein